MKKTKRGFALRQLWGNKKTRIKYRKNGAGFTLVELLVVVAIIGLLVGMLVINIPNIKSKARDSERVSDVASIATALALYHNDFNTYPLWTEGGYINGNDDPLSLALKNAGTMHAVPADPLNTDEYRYYYQSVTGRDYYLEYYLETDSISGKSKGRNYITP